MNVLGCSASLTRREKIDICVNSIRLYLGMDESDAAAFLSDLASRFDDSVFNAALRHLRREEEDRVLRLLEVGAADAIGFPEYCWN